MVNILCEVWRGELEYNHSQHVLESKCTSGSTNTVFLSFKTQSRQSAKLFLQSLELGLPQPPTRRRVCPPVLGEGARSLARVGLGLGRVPIPTRGHTLWYCFYIHTLWFKVFSRDQIGVASADCWNWGKWGLIECMWKVSILGWFVGLLVLVQEILSRLGCSSRPSTAFFPHPTQLHFICPPHPTSWAGSRAASPVSE